MNREIGKWVLSHKHIWREPLPSYIRASAAAPTALSPPPPSYVPRSFLFPSSVPRVSSRETHPEALATTTAVAAWRGGGKRLYCIITDRVRSETGWLVACAGRTGNESKTIQNQEKRGDWKIILLFIIVGIYHSLFLFLFQITMVKFNEASMLKGTKTSARVNARQSSGPIDKIQWTNIKDCVLPTSGTDAFASTGMFE